MADFTRGEFDARLQATEERMNARLADIAADIKLINNSLGNIHSSYSTFSGRVEVALKELNGKIDKTEEATRSYKWWILGTGLTVAVTVVGIVAAFLAFGLQAFEAAVALFEAGGG